MRVWLLATHAFLEALLVEHWIMHGAAAFAAAWPSQGKEGECSILVT